MKQSREVHLDSLRGIAALIVVFTHYFAAFYPYSVFGNQWGFHQQAFWENVFFFPPFGLITAGQFAVCLFFILSGYVLSYSQLGEPLHIQKILASIIKRPIRLGGLVCSSIIIAAILWYSGLFFNIAVSELVGSTHWWNNFWKGDFDFYNFFKTLTTSAFSQGSIYNSPLWTIKYELYGSIMVYLFVLFLGRFKFRLVFSIILVFLFKDSLYQGFWIGLLIADLVKNYACRNPVKLQNIYFYVLLIIFIYISSDPNYVDTKFIKMTIYSFLPVDYVHGGGYPMFSALLIFILVISNDKLKILLSHPVLQFLGEISYGLYVMHFLVLGSLSAWLFLILNDYFSYTQSFVIVIFSNLPLSILVAYLATKYIDNPSIALARNIGNQAVNLSPIKRALQRLSTVK